MTNPAPENGEASIENAVAWLSTHLDDCPRPIVPYIKQAYGLGNAEAVEAIRRATLKRAEAKDG